ncbi:thioredoxin family protein, partial [Mesotoga prima]
MKIEIFGSGCPRCKQTEKIMKMAVEELDSDAIIEKVTDMMAIMEKGIVST